MRLIKIKRVKILSQIGKTSLAESADSFVLSIPNLILSEEFCALQFYQYGKYIEATEISLSLVEQNNRNYNVLHLLGLIAIRTDEFTKAVDLLFKAIEVFSSNALVYNDLGIALITIDLITDAMYCFEQSIIIDPSNCLSYHNLALVQQKEHHDEWKSIEKMVL